MPAQETDDNFSLRMADGMRQSKMLKVFSSVPFAKYLFHNVIVNAMTLWERRKMAMEMAALGNGDVDAHLSFCLGKWQRLIGPMQVQSEIRGLLAIISKDQPKTFMEIGTANGGTLFLFCGMASKGCEGISIDLPGGKFGGGYPAYREGMYRSFARWGQKLHLLRATSHDPKTKLKAEGILKGRKLDFLFIDGDHTYEGAKQDFEMYSELVKEGGVIALHDIVVHPKETGCEVSRLWEEIKKKHRTKEMIQDKAQGWGGIGVVFK